jgi:hypothetical protein
MRQAESAARAVGLRGDIRISGLRGRQNLNGRQDLSNVIRAQRNNPRNPRNPLILSLRIRRSTTAKSQL